MEFETIAQTAERLNVTTRAVQKWASAGKIPGAQKVGRDWQIPKGITGPLNSKINIKSVHKSEKIRMPLPLLNGSFPIGQCEEYIKNIDDEDDRNIALGEYYYYSGQAEKAVQIAEPYLDSHDESLRYSATFICTFANLSLGHLHLAKFALDVIETDLNNILEAEASLEKHSIGIFAARTTSILLHMPVPQTSPLEDYIAYLPNGLKLFGYYVLAYKAYLEKNYERSLAIADTALSMNVEIYPIATIYTQLIAVIDLMNLMRIEEAKKRFASVWEMAYPDDLIEIFGEHHGLLHGMIEVFFKKDYPEYFQRIIDIACNYGAGWRKMHNIESGEEIAENLTTTEFTIAMLYNRKWTVKEIAYHMDISERVVKKHLTVVYEKLNINSRKELDKYLLR